MTLARRFGGYGASALVGALVGALIVLGVDGLTRVPTRGRSGIATDDGPVRNVAPSPRRLRTHADVLLAWAPGGLPARAEPLVERTPGVRRATTALAALEWIHRSTLPDGTVVDDPPPGLAIPWEVAFVDPKEYAAFVPVGERHRILALERGEALLAETEADLRGAGEGLRIGLADRSVTVTGIVSDVAANGYEAIMTAPPDRRERLDPFLLVHIGRTAKRPTIERTLERALAPGQSLRVRSESETPFLRYGDAVLPQMLIKETFGEFAARPLPNGELHIDPAWRRANIAAHEVPVLGKVTCHRALFPQLRGAFKELRVEGLAFTVDPAQYGGCYSPRFISRDPEGRLSHHSWGIAFDVNVADNAFGTKADQDARLVEVMERWGFTWGGRWIVPDGMHFEWQRFP